MWASGPTIYNLMRFKLSMLVLKIKYLPIILVYSGWPTTLNSVGDCLEVTTLHTLVHKFQSEREVHPPAYGPELYLHPCIQLQMTIPGYMNYTCTLGILQALTGFWISSVQYIIIIIILLSLTCEWGECKYFDVELAHPFKCSLDHFALNCAWENTVIQLIKANKYNWNPPCE